MQRKKLANTILIATVCMAIFTSCTRTKGDAYKQYLSGGEIVYPGRADTVIVGAGYKRVQLAVVLGNDPLVKRVRVYWNNKMDSLDAAVTHTTGKDTANVVIPGLVEGNYNFTVVTFDAENHRSVDFNISGIAYGDSYVSSLTNRVLKSVTQDKYGSVVLSWGGAADGDLGTEVDYVGRDGSPHKIITPATETTTVLSDYQDNSLATYQSLYKPDATAFEYFSVASVEITLPAFERQFDKSNFQIVILPTDVLEGGYGWLENYIWDEKYDPDGFATQSQIPCWFTFDAGESASLNRFKVWQANDRLYERESVKTFELYGSNSPDPDGSWASWTQIGSYTSVKPSGLPVGQTTQEDIDFAKAGEEFTAPNGTPKFRYFRFKLLSNWGGGTFMTMEEITFYTKDR